MQRETVGYLIDKYGYALAQIIPMTVEQRLYTDKVLADMLAETVEVVTKELQEICYNTVIKEVEGKDEQ